MSHRHRCIFPDGIRCMICGKPKLDAMTRRDGEPETAEHRGQEKPQVRHCRPTRLHRQIDVAAGRQIHQSEWEKAAGQRRE